MKASAGPADGEDYATISLLPNATHDGSVLVLQGLQQEGTESRGAISCDPVNQRQLMSALGISAGEEPLANILVESRSSGTVRGAEYHYSRSHPPNTVPGESPTP